MSLENAADSPIFPRPILLVASSMTSGSSSRFVIVLLNEDKVFCSAGVRNLLGLILMVTELLGWRLSTISVAKRVHKPAFLGNGISVI
jgi:hypothetical protein